MNNLDCKAEIMGYVSLEPLCADSWHLVKVLRLLLMLCCMGLFAGCASLSQKHQDQTASVDPNTITIESNLQHDIESENGWWQIGFHRHYEYDDEVQWQYDALLALKVLKPLIDKEKEIKLWRFHRRAVPDKVAHRFSFIFYTTRKIGEAIYQQVNEHPLIKELLTAQHLERLSFYNINKKLRSGIGDTSDKKWPVELQKTWPYFIMGASQTWLGLVEYYYSELSIGKNADLQEQLEGFKKVADKIDLIWKHSGSHAFLHHLNALFAYQELYIIERKLSRF